MQNQIMDTELTLISVTQRVRKVKVSEMQEDERPRAGRHYALMRGPTAWMKVGDNL
jgi:hypothetical protein